VWEMAGSILGPSMASIRPRQISFRLFSVHLTMLLPSDANLRADAVVKQPAEATLDLS
jgi:hypothetical protein